MSGSRWQKGFPELSGTPNKLSEILISGALPAENYFAWATQEYKLPFLADAFFETSKNFKHVLNNPSPEWNEFFFPVNEWQGVVYIACLEPQPVTLSKPHTLVLGSPLAMRSLWAKMEKPAAAPAFSEITATPTAPPRAGPKPVDEITASITINKQARQPLPIRNAAPPQSSQPTPVTQTPPPIAPSAPPVAQPVQQTAPAAPKPTPATEVPLTLQQTPPVATQPITQPKANSFAPLKPTTPLAHSAPAKEVAFTPNEESEIRPVENNHPTDPPEEQTNPLININFDGAAPSQATLTAIPQAPAPVTPTPVATTPFSDSHTVGFNATKTNVKLNPNFEATNINIQREVTNVAKVSGASANADFTSTRTIMPFEKTSQFTFTRTIYSPQVIIEAEPKIENNSDPQQALLSAFKILQNHYKKLMWIVRDQKGYAYPIACNADWDFKEEAWNEPMAFKHPNPFRVAKLTQKPYHGAVFESPATDKFFALWNGGKKPDQFTVVPVVMFGKVFGYLVGSEMGPQFDKVSSLEVMQSAGKELLDTFIKIHKGHSEAA